MTLAFRLCDRKRRFVWSHSFVWSHIVFDWNNAMNAKLVELLQQMLETELGGVKIYQTALECARNPKLREEWEFL